MDRGTRVPNYWLANCALVAAGLLSFSAGITGRAFGRSVVVDLRPFDLGFGFSSSFFPWD